MIGMDSTSSERMDLEDVRRSLEKASTVLEALSDAFQPPIVTVLRPGFAMRFADAARRFRFYADEFETFGIERGWPKPEPLDAIFGFDARADTKEMMLEAAETALQLIRDSNESLLQHHQQTKDFGDGQERRFLARFLDILVREMAYWPRLINAARRVENNSSFALQLLDEIAAEEFV